MSTFYFIFATNIVVVTLAGTGTGDQTPEMTSAEFQARRERLQKIVRGMTEQEVRNLVGKPDEIRARRLTPWLGGLEAEYEWAYGVQQPGCYASVGLVAFDANRKALSARSPVWAVHGLKDYPLTETAVRTTTGAYSQLEEVSIDSNVGGRSHDSRKYQTATATLINDGTESLEYKASSGFVYIVEIFDTDKRLLARFDRRNSSSTLNQAHPSLAPGQRFTKSVPLWLTNAGFGPPSPGTYYVRCLFQSASGEYYPSNLVKFDFPEPAPGASWMTPCRDVWVGITIRGRLVSVDASRALGGAAIGARASTDGVVTAHRLPFHAEPNDDEFGQDFPRSQNDGGFTIFLGEAVDLCGDLWPVTVKQGYPRPDHVELVIVHAGCEQTISLDITEETALFPCPSHRGPVVKFREPVLVPSCDDD